MRQTDSLYHIVRHSKDYSIVTEKQTKKYQLVFSKRVVDSVTFMMYSYGYKAMLTDEDMDNVDILMDLF